MNASEILDSTPAPTNETQPIQETTEQVTQETKAQDDPRFSLLAKLERKLKLQEQEFKQKQKELEDKSNKYKVFEEYEQEIESNPLQFLEKKGWDIKKINDWFIQNHKDEDLDPVAKQFAEMKKEMDKLKAELTQTYEEKLSAKEKEIMAKDYERQVAEFKAQVKTTLASNKEKYELINSEEEGMDLVYEVILEDIQRQKSSGKQENELVLMKIEDAADRVEAYLDSRVQKYLNLNKYRNKKSDNENSVEDFIKKSQAPQTLTNSFSPKSKSVEELSEQERVQAAINMIKSGNYKF